MDRGFLLVHLEIIAHEARFVLGEFTQLPRAAKQLWGGEMNKTFLLASSMAASVMWAALAATPAQAAGTVILEGSDSIGFHCPLGQTAACNYRDQTFSAIGAADARPIAVVGLNVLG